MMLTVQNMPDCVPRQQSPTRAEPSFRDDFRYIDEDDKNIPYHARQNSRPFTYGVNSTMIAESKGLSSPSLVRKASFNKSHGDTLNKVQTQVFPAPKPSSKFSYENPHYNTEKFNAQRYDSRKYNGVQKYNTYNPTRDAEKYNAYAANGDFPNKNNTYTREFKEEFYKDQVRRYDPFKKEGYETKIPLSDYKSLKSFESTPGYDQTDLTPHWESSYRTEHNDS